MTRNSPFYLLAAAALLYLLILFPQFGKNIFTYDNFYNLWRAERFIPEPLSIFEPTFATRFSPFYYPLLLLIHSLFGFNPFVYGFANGVLHLLNAILLFKLMSRLSGTATKTPALLASIFFLFSSTQWGVVGELGQTYRLACIALFLLSLLFFVRWMFQGRKRDWIFSLLFFMGTFGFSEDALPLPLLLAAMTFLVPFSPRPLSLFQKRVPLLPFFLVSLIYGSFSLSLGAPQGAHLHLGFHVPFNFLVLMRELVQFLLIPRPEFVPLPGLPGILIRLLPALFIFFFVGFLWKWKWIDRFLILGIAWIGMTGLLYTLRPMPGVWQGRYLYLPGMGEAVLVGMILYRMGNSLKTGFLKGCWVGIIFYGWVLNVSTLLFMMERARSGFPVAVREELPVVFSITNAIRDQYGAPPEIPPDLVLAVEGMPFSISRLKELLPTYYLTLPREIVEAKEGRPLAVPTPPENSRMLYLKWEAGRLQEVSPIPSS